MASKQNPVKLMLDIERMQKKLEEKMELLKKINKKEEKKEYVQKKCREHNKDIGKTGAPSEKRAKARDVKSKKVSFHLQNATPGSATNVEETTSSSSKATREISNKRAKARSKSESSAARLRSSGAEGSTGASPAKIPKLDGDIEKNNGEANETNEIKAESDKDLQGFALPLHVNTNVDQSQDDLQNDPVNLSQCDLDDPHIIPSSQQPPSKQRHNKKSQRRRSLPVFRTTDTVHVTTNLNKTFTIATAPASYESDDHDLGENRGNKEMMETEDQSVNTDVKLKNGEKQSNDNVTVNDNDIVHTVSGTKPVLVEHRSPRNKPDETIGKFSIPISVNTRMVDHPLEVDNVGKEEPVGLDKGNKGFVEANSFAEGQGLVPQSQDKNHMRGKKKKKKTKVTDSLDYSFLDDDSHDMYSQIKSRRRGSRGVSFPVYLDSHYSIDTSLMQYSEELISQNASFDASQKCGEPVTEPLKEKRQAGPPEGTQGNTAATEGRNSLSNTMPGSSEEGVDSTRAPLIPKLKPAKDACCVMHFSLPDSQFVQLKLNKSYDNLDISELLPENVVDSVSAKDACRGTKKAKRGTKCDESEENDPVRCEINTEVSKEVHDSDVGDNDNVNVSAIKREIVDSSRKSMHVKGAGRARGRGRGAKPRDMTGANSYGEVDGEQGGRSTGITDKGTGGEESAETIGTIGVEQNEEERLDKKKTSKSKQGGTGGASRGRKRGRPKKSGLAPADAKDDDGGLRNSGGLKYSLTESTTSQAPEHLVTDDCLASTHVDIGDDEVDSNSEIALLSKMSQNTSLKKRGRGNGADKTSQSGKAKRKTKDVCDGNIKSKEPKTEEGVPVPRSRGRGKSKPRQSNNSRKARGRRGKNSAVNDRNEGTDDEMLSHNSDYNEKITTEEKHDCNHGNEITVMFNVSGDAYLDLDMSPTPVSETLPEDWYQGTRSDGDAKSGTEGTSVGTDRDYSETGKSNSANEYKVIHGTTSGRNVPCASDNNRRENNEETFSDENKEATSHTQVKKDNAQRVVVSNALTTAAKEGQIDCAVTHMQTERHDNSDLHTESSALSGQNKCRRQSQNELEGPVTITIPGEYQVHGKEVTEGMANDEKCAETERKGLNVRDNETKTMQPKLDEKDKTEDLQASKITEENDKSSQAADCLGSKEVSEELKEKQLVKSSEAQLKVASGQEVEPLSGEDKVMTLKRDVEQMVPMKTSKMEPPVIDETQMSTPDVELGEMKLASSSDTQEMATPKGQSRSVEEQHGAPLELDDMKKVRDDERTDDLMVREGDEKSSGVARVSEVSDEEEKREIRERDQRIGEKLLQQDTGGREETDGLTERWGKLRQQFTDTKREIRGRIETKTAESDHMVNDFTEQRVVPLRSENEEEKRAPLNKEDDDKLVQQELDDSSEELEKYEPEKDIVAVGTGGVEDGGGHMEESDANNQKLVSQDSERDDEPLQPVETCGVEKGVPLDTETEDDEFALQQTPEIEEFLQQETEDEEEFALPENREVAPPTQGTVGEMTSSDSESRDVERKSNTPVPSNEREHDTIQTRSLGKENSDSKGSDTVMQSGMVHKGILAEDLDDEVPETDTDGGYTHSDTDSQDDGVAQYFRNCNERRDEAEGRESTDNAHADTDSQDEGTEKWLEDLKEKKDETWDRESEAHSDTDIAEDLGVIVPLGLEDDNELKGSIRDGNVEGENKMMELTTQGNNAEDVLHLSSAQERKSSLVEQTGGQCSRSLQVKGVASDEFDEEIVFWTEQGHDVLVNQDVTVTVSRTEDVTPRPEARATLKSYVMVQADSDDSGENLMDDLSDDGDLIRSAADDQDNSADGDLERSRDCDLDRSEESALSGSSSVEGQGQDEQPVPSTHGFIHLQQRIEVDSPDGSIIQCGVAGTGRQGGHVTDYLVVCMEGGEIQLWCSGADNGQFKLQHTWSNFEDSVILLAKTVLCKERIAFMLLSQDDTYWKGRVYVYDKKTHNFIICETPRSKYKQPVPCILSDREICIAHPHVTSSRVSDEVTRYTEVTKYMLSRDVSSCMSDLMLNGVADTVTSLLHLDSEKSALLATSYNALYIWNHDSGSMLKQIGLTTALTPESDLQSAALLTACHSVRVVNGILYLTVTKSYSGSDQVCVLAVNPATSKCLTFATMTSSTSQSVQPFNTDSPGDKMREVHAYGDLLCALTDHALLLWDVTSGRLVASKKTKPSNTVCISHSGRFYLAAGSGVSVYGMDAQKDE